MNTIGSPTASSGRPSTERRPFNHLHGLAAAGGAYWAMQQNRAETLRRRIELYRRLLSKGVDAGLARVYFFEIGEAELELAEMPMPEPEPGKLRTCGHCATAPEIPRPARLMP